MGTTGQQRTAVLREQRRRRVLALAAEQAGVVSRRQVYAAGLTRAEVLANIKAARWRRLLSQSICVHTGPVPEAAWLWASARMDRRFPWSLQSAK